MSCHSHELWLDSTLRGFLVPWPLWKPLSPRSESGALWTVISPEDNIWCKRGKRIQAVGWVSTEEQRHTCSHVASMKRNVERWTTVFHFLSQPWVLFLHLCLLHHPPHPRFKFHTCEQGSRGEKCGKIKKAVQSPSLDSAWGKGLGMVGRFCSGDKCFLLPSIRCSPERRLERRGNLEKLSSLTPETGLIDLWFPSCLCSLE